MLGCKAYKALKDIYPHLCIIHMLGIIQGSPFQKEALLEQASSSMECLRSADTCPVLQTTVHSCELPY